MSGLKYIVVMGVSGCGKSTLARALAGAVGGTLIEGDEYHPTENKAKMAAGIPLTDDDRWPWYDRLIAATQAAASAGKPVVLSCSALKQSYRDRLADGLPGIRFVFLKGGFETINTRLETRRGHYMPAALLESQFAALEEPRDAITLDIELSLEQLLQRALDQLGLPNAS